MVIQRLGLVVGASILAVGLQGQQPQAQQPQSPPSGQTAPGTQTLQGGPGSPQSAAPQQPAAPQQLAIVIYQIDFDPSGTAFATNKPKLEGDVYVFSAWPEGDMVRVPQAKVKKVTQRTTDLSKESVYQIDLVPSGRIIAKADPKVQGGTYVFYRWKDGTLMSLRKSDVKGVAHLTGLPAFKAQQEEMGAALIGNLPMEGGGTVKVIGTAPVVQSVDGVDPNANLPPGNWIYQGVPGVTDAYAPANATVASPGDVPRAPAPQPTRPPS